MPADAAARGLGRPHQNALLRPCRVKRVRSPDVAPTAGTRRGPSTARTRPTARLAPGARTTETNSIANRGCSRGPRRPRGAGKEPCPVCVCAQLFARTQCVRLCPHALGGMGGCAHTQNPDFACVRAPQECAHAAVVRYVAVFTCRILVTRSSRGGLRLQQSCCSRSPTPHGLCARALSERPPGSADAAPRRPRRCPLTRFRSRGHPKVPRGSSATTPAIHGPQQTDHATRRFGQPLRAPAATPARASEAVCARAVSAHLVRAAVSARTRGVWGVRAHTQTRSFCVCAHPERRARTHPLRRVRPGQRLLGDDNFSAIGSTDPRGGRAIQHDPPTLTPGSGCGLRSAHAT